MPEDLAQIRGMARAIGVLEEALVVAVSEAAGAGADRGELAEAVGVSRATLYRRFLDSRAPAPGSSAGTGLAS